MKLNSFLQCSFCKGPLFIIITMYQPSSAVACQYQLARLPIYPDISQLQRKSVLNRKFYLLIILWIPQIIHPTHSTLLSLCSTFRSNIVKWKTSLFLEPEVFFVSSRSSSRRVSLAGVVSRLTVCSLLPGHCWQFGPITGKDGSRAANQSTEIRCI